MAEGLSRAMARAEELRLTSPRRVRVRIVTRHGDLEPGIIITARIEAKTGPEFECQSGKGVRHIAFADLDARAHELPDLVNAAAAEVEAAVLAAPAPPQRPSLREEEFDAEAFEELIQASYRAMVKVTGDLLRDAPTLSRDGAGEAFAIAAMKVAALAAQGAHLELDELNQILKSQYRDVRERVTNRLASEHIGAAPSLN